MVDLVVSQNFITGFDGEYFTLTSLGDLGKPHVEAFEDVNALDYKIAELEREGYEVHYSPCIETELYRYVY